MSNAESYRYRLAAKMVDKFVKDLKDKTGVRASVMMDHVNPLMQENRYLTRLITLEMLEDEFIKAYPIELKNNPLKTKGRKLDSVEARCVFCHIARERLRYSYTAIGKYLNKDHTSIIHMNKRANNLLESDDKFSFIYNKTIENLKQVYDKSSTEYSEREHKS